MQPFLLAAVVAQAFNLSCAGTKTNKTIGLEGSESYSHVYRVDLAKGVYCEDRCETIHPIAAIQPTRLELESQDEKASGETRQFYNIINRETGQQNISEYSRTRTLGQIYVTWDGQCEKLPFAGFPTFSTKF